MHNKTATVITGTGCYIPQFVKTNNDFTGHSFYAEDNTALDIEPHVIVEKFKKITGIEERRYAPSNIESSDMAAIAAQKAIDLVKGQKNKINKEPEVKTDVKVQ